MPKRTTGLPKSTILAAGAESELLERLSCDEVRDFSEQEMEFPKATIFIIGNEFCERFSYYGMRAVLVIYLRTILFFSEDISTSLYHVFMTLCYTFPVLGGIIADSVLGKFRTIIYFSLVYVVGGVVLLLAATSLLPFQTTVSLLGLVLVSLGAGCMKPCVSSFGGEQFGPEQKNELNKFFSIFYFSVNVGSLLSCFMTPIFRKNVSCFGNDSCFPLAFGFPALLLLFATGIFLCGKPYYIIRKPDENILLLTVKCIRCALRNKMTQKPGREHWLDYARDEYDKKQISDIKALLRASVLLIPLPVFWALYDQQGSRWVFQAMQMDNMLYGFEIKPDQMQTLCPLCVLLLIPIFNIYLYPALRVIGVTTPLRKIIVGGYLAATSYIISAILDIYIENTVISNTYKIHILWQVPQIIVLAVGEIMFAVTCLEFCFTQAPASMKCVLASEQLLTIGVGNLLVAIISEIKFFESQAYEFLLFAALMMVDMILLTFLAIHYTYYDDELEEDTDSKS